LPHVSSDQPEGIGRATRSPEGGALLFGLAPGGVCRAGPVARTAGELLPHRFTLTRLAAGGLLSVALSLRLPSLDVIQHPALWSSDFPPVSRGKPAVACSTPASCQKNLHHETRWQAAAARWAFMWRLISCPMRADGCRKAICSGSGSRLVRHLPAGTGVLRTGARVAAWHLPDLPVRPWPSMDVTPPRREARRTESASSAGNCGLRRSAGPR